MKTVTLPVYNRPDRLREMLEALKANRTDGYTLFVAAEPGCPEVVDIVKKIDFMPVVLRVNKRRLGLQANIPLAMRWAMSEGSQFNVYLEDDVILSRDAFDLVEWFRKFDVNAEYACLSLMTFGGNLFRPNMVSETQDIQSWGLCFSVESWHKWIAHGLGFRWPIVPGVQWSEGWDFWLGFYLMMHGVKALRPAVSRAKHVGYTDGVHLHETEGLWESYEQVALSDGTCRGPFYVKKLPEHVWRMARKLSHENLGIAV